MTAIDDSLFDNLDFTGSGVPWATFFGSRCGSKTAASSTIELFVILVNGFQALTIITKCSILDVAPVLDPPLPRIACA